MSGLVHGGVIELRAGEETLLSEKQCRQEREQGFNLSKNYLTECVERVSRFSSSSQRVAKGSLMEM